MGDDVVDPSLGEAFHGVVEATAAERHHAHWDMAGEADDAGPPTGHFHCGAGCRPVNEKDQRFGRMLSLKNVLTRTGFRDIGACSPMIWSSSSPVVWPAALSELRIVSAGGCSAQRRAF